MANEMKMQQEIPEVSTFSITDENIGSFYRLTNRENDCVPNALFFIGAINNITADLLKIVAEKNGMYKDTIEKIFKYLLNREFKFLKVNKKFFYNYCDNILPPGTVIFCGTDNTYNPGHVFLVGKNRKNKLVLLDGQNKQPLCFIEGEKSECFKNYISEEYFLLHSIREI
jgi:hypothetical protein